MHPGTGLHSMRYRTSQINEANVAKDKVRAQRGTHHDTLSAPGPRNSAQNRTVETPKRDPNWRTCATHQLPIRPALRPQKEKRSRHKGPKPTRNITTSERIDRGRQRHPLNNNAAASPPSSRRTCRGGAATAGPKPHQEREMPGASIPDWRPSEIQLPTQCHCWTAPRPTEQPRKFEGSAQ